MTGSAESIDQRLQSLEYRVQRAYSRFVVRTRDASLKRRVDSLLLNGDIEQALELINEVLEPMSSELTEVAQDAVTQESSALGKMLGLLLLVDLLSPRVIEMTRRHRYEALRSIMMMQSDSVRNAVVRAMSEDTGVNSAFWNAIGLSPRLERALYRYRKLLEDQKLPKGEIAIMTRSYRDQLRAVRRKQIARDVAGRLISEVQDLVIREAVASGAIPENRIVRVWQRIPDDRVRDAHDVMQGQQAGINELFEDGNGNKLRYPRDPSAPPETRINCRCSLDIKLK
jgi:hypothetical protein